METVSKVFRVISNILVSIASVLILFSTLLTTVNACLRYFAGAPVSWADELSIYMIIMPVFFALPMLEYSNSQLSVTAFVDRFQSKAVKLVFMIIRAVVTLVLTGGMAYYGFLAVKSSLRMSVVTPVLRIPKGILYAIVAGCFLLAVIAWLIILARKGEFDK